MNALALAIIAMFIILQTTKGPLAEKLGFTS